MSYELRRLATAEDWSSLHVIRRATLFASGGMATSFAMTRTIRTIVRSPDNQPLLLVLAGEAIGVVRLDRRGADGGVVRLVGIVPEKQMQGHGRMLQQLVETTARARGMRRLAVNAHPSAVGFYEKTGWLKEAWDASELTGIATDCVQMTKRI